MAPAALAARERPVSRLGGAMLVAVAGELVADKLPAMRARVEPPGIAARLTTSAWSGHRVAGPAGAAIAAGAAMASAQAGYRLRMAAGGVLPALAEDAVAVTLATVATA